MNAGAGPRAACDSARSKDRCAPAGRGGQRSVGRRTLRAPRRRGLRQSAVSRRCGSRIARHRGRPSRRPEGETGRRRERRRSTRTVKPGAREGRAHATCQCLQRARPGSRRRAVPQLLGELVVTHGAPVLGGQERQQMMALRARQELLVQDATSRLDEELPGQVDAKGRGDDGIRARTVLGRSGFRSCSRVERTRSSCTAS